MLITYSRCCGPVPGDSILGSFTAGHGLAVHTTDCPNVAELRKQPDKFLMVDWDEELDKTFTVRLEVNLSNEPGSFAEVARVIAENGSNINHVDTHAGADELVKVDFLIDVKDRVHLAKVMKAIYRLTRVEKVTRHKG